MVRGVDWSPLADGDPVPGEAMEVASLARRYQDTADEISSQAASLLRLAGDGDAGWDSEAGRVFAQHARDLAGQVRKAQGRNEAASGALAAWVEPLEHAQSEAGAALVQARAADAQRTANHPIASLVGLTPEEVQATKARRTAAYDAASDDLAAARRRFDAAVEGYRDTAHRLAKQLREVVDHDGLKDSRWDKFKGWISDHAGIIHFITKIAGIIATVAGVLSLVLGWVPILGEVLLVVAAVASAVELIGNLLLALSGDGSWWAVGLSVVSLASFGTGRLIGGSLKAAAKMHIDLPGRAAAFAAKAERLGLKTPRNAANFYSGGDGAANLTATSFAERTGTKVVQTTPGGKALEDERLYDLIRLFTIQGVAGV